MADGIIFDCDGTLADTMPIHYVAWRDTLARFGIHFSEDRFYALGGCPAAKVVQILSGEQSVVVDPVAVAEQKEACFLESLAEVQAIEPVVAVVRQHAGRTPLAVGSGSGRDVVTRILAELGILDAFQCVVTSEDTQRHKPEPDVFLLAAERLGVSPTRCTVYEDSDLGIEAARRAGMQWVDVREFHTPRRITEAG